MFGGNAKTHFQVLGRSNNSLGYMMSPFGDDRWDLDDSEKLRKIYKKSDLVSPSTMNFQAQMQQQQGNNMQSHQSGGNVMSNSTYQPGVKPNCYGYIHQSETSQGYIPKAEMARACQALPMHQQQQQQQPAQSPQVFYPNIYTYQQKAQSSMQHSTAEMTQGYRPPPTRHHNGLNHDEIKQRSRMVCAQPNYQQPHQLSQSMSQVTNICGQCQHSPSVQAVQSNPNPEYYNQKQWKSSPDVPVWIAGTTSYRPFGPAEPTPNPYYPPREKNEYIPLN